MNERELHLKKFLEANPNDSFVLYALATERVNAGDDEGALKWFNELLERNPDYTGTYYHVGKLYERRTDKDNAERFYREGMKRTQSKDAHAYRELQEALNQLLFNDDE